MCVKQLSTLNRYFQSAFYVCDTVLDTAGSAVKKRSPLCRGKTGARQSDGRMTSLGAVCTGGSVSGR